MGGQKRRPAGGNRTGQGRIGNQSVVTDAVHGYRIGFAGATVVLTLRAVSDEFGRFVCLERVP